MSEITIIHFSLYESVLLFEMLFFFFCQQNLVPDEETVDEIYEVLLSLATQRNVKVSYRSISTPPPRVLTLTWCKDIESPG